MFNTVKEVEEFLNKKPEQWKVTGEIQTQQEVIKKLDVYSVECGLENSRISNKYKKDKGMWTPHEQWTGKDQVTFEQNNQKKLDIENEIKIRKELIKILQGYKEQKYTQMSFDFNSLTEKLQKYI